VGDWLQFEEGSRSYRVAGLDTLRSDLIRASGELNQLIHDRYRACGEVLRHFHGRPAREFATRANEMLSAMVDLDGALSEAARVLQGFPQDRMLLAWVAELGRSRSARPPRVEPPSAPADRVGIDVDAVRRYVGSVGGADERLVWLARQAEPDGLEAMEARRAGGGGLLGLPLTPLAPPAPLAPLADQVLEWERIPARQLVPLPDLVPLALAVQSHSRAAAELALATADAFARADADLVAVLDRNPDLSGYVTAAFARRLQHSPTLREAVAGRDALLTRRDVLRHQAAMRAYATAWEHLRLFDTAAKGGKPDGRISRADLAAVAGNRKLAPDVRKAASLLLRRLEDEGRGSLRRDDVIRRVVDGQAFADDPAAARRFVESLPVAAAGRKGLPVGLCSDDGVKALANAALIGAGDSLSAQQRVIAHLPETDAGTRNTLITAFYDILGDKVNAAIAGPAALDPGTPGHPGANWLMYAPWASDGVHRVITGDMQVFGVGPRQEQRQGAADGNQWIFTDITARFAAFVELYEANPAPSAADLERFFAGNFHDGDAEIRKGFAAYVAARAERDPGRRQALMFQGNVSVATHEQAGVQRYLEAAGRLVPDRLEPRYIDLKIGEHVVFVDESVRSMADRSNLVAPMKILDLDPSARSLADYSTPGAGFTLDRRAAGPGIVHLEPLSGVKGFPTSMAEWHAGGGAIFRPGIGGEEVALPTDPDAQAGSGARSWADPNERMWTITKLFEQTHTDPSLWETDQLKRSFANFEWLAEEARPR
jgi:hypothetical protein